MAKKPAMILYHTGLIVENLDDAMEKMGDALGLNWFTPRKATPPFQSPGGILDREAEAGLPRDRRCAMRLALSQ